MGIAIPIVSLAATVIGAGVSAAGALQTAEAQSQAASYQAQVAANNQVIAGQNATYAKEAGQSQEMQQELTTRAALGNAVAAQASQGLDVNTGSPVEVRKSTAALGTLSALNIRNNAAREAYGFLVQGSNYQAQSGLYSMEAENATAAGNISAFGSLIGGAAKAGSLYSELSRTGAFNANPPTLIGGSGGSAASGP